MFNEKTNTTDAFSTSNASLTSPKSEVTIVAHDGPFHSDDVFAVASLVLLLTETDFAGLTNPPSVKIVRSRDEVTIREANYVVDVGGEYDPEKNLFDHHQRGGAGERTNGIPYASFGLVWKHFGEKISGLNLKNGMVVHPAIHPDVASAVAETVDQRLVQPIDAIDNGVSVWKEVVIGLKPFDISAIIGAMNLNWNEEATGGGVDVNASDSPKISKTNDIFIQAVELAKSIITREILAAQSDIEGESFAVEAYKSSHDKRLIVLDREYPWEKIYSKFPEPLFVIYPKENNWRIKAVRNSVNSFENRKDLPATWAGKRGAELSAITGIPGGVFCHNKLFTAGAETKEAAVAMARISLDK